MSSQARDLYTRLQVQQDDQTEVLQDQVGKPLHLGASSMTALVFRRAALEQLFREMQISLYANPDAGAVETLDADFAANQGVTFSLAEGF